MVNGFDSSTGVTTGKLTTGNSRQEVIEKIAEWVLDGHLTCIYCEADKGGNLECEEEEEVMCDVLRKDIDQLFIDVPELVILADDQTLPVNAYEQSRQNFGVDALYGYTPYRKAQQDMRKANWRKLLPPEGKK